MVLGQDGARQTPLASFWPERSWQQRTLHFLNCSLDKKEMPIPELCLARTCEGARKKPHGCKRGKKCPLSVFDSSCPGLMDHRADFLVHFFLLTMMNYFFYSKRQDNNRNNFWCSDSTFW